MKKLIFFTIALLLLISACSTARQKLSPQGNVDFKTANVYYAQQNVEQAEKYYTKVLTDNPEHAVALRRLADINLRKGELFVERKVEFSNLAFEYYTKAIAITESYPEITDQEKIDLRDMKKRKESSWVRIYEVATIELKNGNTAKAMELFELTSKLEPSRTEPLIQLKEIYLKELKNDAKAEQILLTLIKDNPDKLEALLELGAFYYNKENYTEAVKYFERARPQIPRDVTNIVNISACYFELGEFTKAMAATQMAMELDPTNVDLVDNAYSISLKMNDKTQALVYLKQLIDRRTDVKDFEDILLILQEKEDYRDLIFYAEKWHNWDKANKFPVQYIIFAAQKTNNKSLESKYAAIYKTMP
ncbi:MAG: tetratricopeptide repeat protein [Candidatus Cloacimonetes bacterium]|nr:tetratricopeptide repeat protein [Candidatus Cloacimonadota bacterium]